MAQDQFPTCGILYHVFFYANEKCKNVYIDVKRQISLSCRRGCFLLEFGDGGEAFEEHGSPVHHLPTNLNHHEDSSKENGGTAALLYLFTLREANYNSGTARKKKYR
jgi:hypothetical protein